MKDSLCRGTQIKYKYKVLFECCNINMSSMLHSGTKLFVFVNLRYNGTTVEGLQN